jgi:hypothetical protein
MSDATMQSEYPEAAQRLAVCSSQIKTKFQDSYADYGDGVKNNAKRGIELNERNGLETIKRMHSYLSRAETYYDNADSTSDCGYISYLLWGGKAALGWSRNKLRELGELNED